MVVKLEKPVILIGGAPPGWRDHEDAFGGVLRADDRIFRVAGVSRTAPANSLSLTHWLSTNSYWFSIFELMK